MWTLIEDHFDPKQMYHHESLFTIGNGYLSTRGAFEEGFPGDRRANFVHGVFDDVPIVFTELVNAPDWLPLAVYLDGERFSMDSGKFEEYRRAIDLRSGLLTRQVKWVSPSGKAVELTFERFASLADEHLLCLRCKAVPAYAGKLEFRLSINGNTDNEGFSHWQWVDQGLSQGDFIYLRDRTRKTGQEVAFAMQVKSSPPPDEVVFCDVENTPTRMLTFRTSPGKEIIVEKLVTVATSRDSADPVHLALEHLSQSSGWEQAFTDHRRAWQSEWDRMDITIEGDDEAQLAVRLSLFQLFIAAPRHDDRVNIGAKTLSGFGYRGHSFWDTETFMLPVFIHTAPHIARNLLNYRYQRLPAARDKACANGYEGAQFPWESADTGEEVTPTWVPHYSDRTQSIRIWTGDIEIHISADIAYAACLYWKVTGDDAWFIERGAEIVLDTAKFWASRAEWNAGAGKYEYTDVIGPDEYHDHVDNNYYTNYMARWNLRTALDVFTWLQVTAPARAEQLQACLDLTPTRLAAWQDVISRVYLPVQPGGLIEQFQGYFKRQDVDLAALEPHHISAQLYFGIEGCSQTQVLKQPDVLMLPYLMWDEFDRSQVVANYDYYSPRTDFSYGSSLGPSIQATLTSRLGDSETAYKFFIQAARADLLDVRGNSGDGIHGASAGGLWQAVVTGFAGLKLFSDHWEVHPCLPAHWKRLSFHFTHLGKLQTVDISNPPA